MNAKRKVFASLAERNGHMLVLGATRTGKTRLAELPDQPGHPPRRDRHRAGSKGRLRPFATDSPRSPTRRPSERPAHRSLAISGTFRRPTTPIASYHSPAEIASRIAGQLPGKESPQHSGISPGDSSMPLQQRWTRLDQTPTYAKVTSYIENIEPLLVEYYERLFSSLRIPEWRRSAQSHADVVNPEKDCQVPARLRTVHTGAHPDLQEKQDQGHDCRRSAGQPALRSGLLRQDHRLAASVAGQASV